MGILSDEMRSLPESFEPFAQGLRDLGYVEVRNIAFERWCSEHKGLSDAPIKQPPAISNRHHDQDFVGSRRVGHVGVGCGIPEKLLSANRS